MLWGSNPGYSLEAAVLGYSIRTTGTRHEMVLLHSADVPHGWLNLLRKVGWTLRLVEKLECHRSIYAGGRFEHTFTKLQVLNLVQYRKVVLLDTDLLFRFNNDHLFNRQAPAALRRHASADFPDGQVMDQRSFFDQNGALTGGINAGVVLLEPKECHYCAMLETIREPREGRSSRMPEQDWLTEYFSSFGWRHLGVTYNYQPHQIIFTNRKGLEDCTRLKTNPENARIAHFSALPKPSHLVVDPKYGPDQTDESEWCGPGRNVSREQIQFANVDMLTAYEQGRHQARWTNQQPSRLNPAAIDAQLRAGTVQLGTDWFIAWNEVRDEFPEVKRLVGIALDRGH